MIKAHPMQYSVNAVSFNVGKQSDWVDLKVYQDLKNLGKPFYPKLSLDQIIEIHKSIKLMRDEILNSKKLISEHELLHSTKVANFFSTIISPFKPSIVSLQEFEFNKNSSYDAMFSLLKKNGYGVIGLGCLAIAFEEAKFEPLGSCATFDEKNNFFSYKQVTLRPGLLVDLMDKKKSVIVRVVSDHLKGFNAQKRKEESLKKNSHDSLPDSYLDRAIRLVKRYHIDDTIPGDAALDLSLETISKLQTVKYNVKSKCEYIGGLSFEKYQQSPDITLYCLDGNSTSKDWGKIHNLHPKRMRLFDIRGYKRDEKNISFTIMDKMDFARRKYDYIYAKVSGKNSQLDVQDTILKKINNSGLLKNPGELVSDHLPVLTTINFQKNL